MFEIISGKHAMWKRGETKDQYKERTINFKGLEFKSKRFT